MKAEHGKYILSNFFDSLKKNVDQLDTTRIENGAHFTDIQLKQLIIEGDPKRKFLLNFAFVTEDEKTRAEILTLLRMMLANTIGPEGKGSMDVKRKVHLYSGDKPVSLGEK